MSSSERQPQPAPEPDPKSKIRLALFRPEMTDEEIQAELDWLAEGLKRDGTARSDKLPE